MTDPPNNVTDLVDLYNATLLDLWNKHKPEREKAVAHCINSAYWIDGAVTWVEQDRRCVETKKWKTGLVVHITINKQARSNAENAIKHAKAHQFQVKAEEPLLIQRKCFLF